MKKILMFLIIGLFLISLASAVVTEDNYVKYGKVDGSGNLIKTNNPINDVNFKGYVCDSSNCGSVSGDLWDGNVLTKVGNFIELVYPTTLQSSFGYGIYVYKEGYIPYEAYSTYAGSEKASDYNNYLSRLEECNSNIKSLIITNDSSKIYVESVIQSPINHAGELDYVPSEIESHYTVDVNVTLNVEEGGSNYYTENKILNIPFSEEKEITFSFDADEGNYSITITTDKGDEKCISGNPVSKTDSIIINAPQCIENITYTDWSDWVNITQCRTNNTMLQKRTRIKYDANNCGFVNQTEIGYNEISCEYNQTDNNPPKSISNLQVESKSYNWIKWGWNNPADSDFNYSIIYLNGSWEVNTPNEYYNATGLDENTSYTITIHTVDDEGNINDTDVSDTAKTEAINNCTCDSDCPNDYYGDKYCNGDDIYKKFYDYFCDNGVCNYNISETFVKPCSFDCENGQCIEEEDEEDEEEDEEDGNRGFRIMEDNKTISGDLGVANYSNLPKIKLGGSESGDFSIWPFVLIILIILLIIIILIVLYLY